MSPSVTPFSVTPSKKNEEKDTEIRYSWEVKGLSNIKRDYGWKRVSEQEREEQEIKLELGTHFNVETMARIFFFFFFSVFRTEEMPLEKQTHEKQSISSDSVTKFTVTNDDGLWF